MTRAIGHFRDAIARDPGYAHAWASLANTQGVRAGLYGTGDALREGMVDARASVDRALVLAPESGYVHAVHASVLMNGGLDYAGAVIAARRGVALSPTAFNVYMLGLSQFGVGDAAGAEALLEQALQLDPLSTSALYWLSIALAAQGKLDEARAAADRNLALRPGTSAGLAQRTFVQVLAGEHAAAFATARTVPDGNWRDIAMAMASQRAGDAAEADRLLQKLIDTSGDGAAYQIAEIYAHRGEPDRAFEWLEHAWTNRDPGLRRLLTDPFLAPYRDDPRFADLCRRLGLTPPNAP